MINKSKVNHNLEKEKLYKTIIKLLEKKIGHKRKQLLHKRKQFLNHLLIKEI